MSATGVLILGYLVRSVHLTALHWVDVSLSILLGLLPVAALGVLVGCLGTPVALQPVFGLGSALLALLGGIFVATKQFPSGVQTVMHLPRLIGRPMRDARSYAARGLVRRGCLCWPLDRRIRRACGCCPCARSEEGLSVAVAPPPVRRTGKNAVGWATEFCPNQP